VGDRDGDRFVSPREQAERIQWMAGRDGLRLLSVASSTMLGLVAEFRRGPFADAAAD
jgi:hypothetical protein